MVKIVFPDYPTKLPLTKGRRKKYFTPEDKLPKKYKTDEYEFKKDKLYSKVDKEFVVKNARFVDVPRYQPLSYNKISTRLKIPVLIKLKEWMNPFMPSSLDMDGPYRVQAIVNDWPVPMHKDLDNMHIYYKAFLDLLKQRGMIKDDSKRFITEAGGFIFNPIEHKDQRSLVFEIEQDLRPQVVNHVMYNLEPKKVMRLDNAYKFGAGLVQSAESEPGVLTPHDGKLLMNFGKTKIIKSNADKMFREVFDFCVNINSACWVEQDFYRIHADRIEKFLLSQGIQVVIYTGK